MLNLMGVLLSGIVLASSVAGTPAALSSKKFDAFVPNDINEFFARSTFSPKYVPFADVDEVIKELDDVYPDSYAFAKRATAPTLFNHSRRTTYYAISLLFNGFPSGTPGVPQLTFKELTKRIYLTTMMHDVALTYDEEILAHPARNMSFEFFGGIMVYEHLNEVYRPGSRQLSNVALGDIVQGVFQHTSVFTTGNSSSSGQLNVYGANLDLLGYDAFGTGENSLRKLWSRRLVAEIEREAPRTGLGTDLIALFLERELGTKPSCILGQRDPEVLLEAVKRKSVLDD